MIAADEELPQPTRAFDDFVGTCPITNDIAQIKDHVIGGRGRKARVKSFEIAMNVA
jgi:hypothetical protein